MELEILPFIPTILYEEKLLRPNNIDNEDSVAWPKTKSGMRVFILFKKKS